VGASLDAGAVGTTRIYIRTGVSWSQQGSALTGTGASGTSRQGKSVSLSSDGNTLAVGGNADNTNVGAVWVFTRTGGTWSQQGSKLQGTGASGASQQGASVALSHTGGDTLAVGGPADASGIGAVWIYTRTAGVWSQEGSKLVGTGRSGGTQSMGWSVSLSSDGNTVAFGAPIDGGTIGAVWVFTRSAGVWSEQSKLVGSGRSGLPTMGHSVSLSHNGNRVAFGGPYDAGGVGAVWIFSRSAGVWTQVGSKLVGAGGVGDSLYWGQGTSLSFDAEGDTMACGADGDDYNSVEGQSWLFDCIV